MQQYRIPHTEIDVSRIAYGCMNIGGGWDDEPLTDADRAKAEDMVLAAVDHGINFFDHADIYRKGKAELAFRDVLDNNPGLRDRIVIQSKCGIRFADDPEPGNPARYDFSYEHIMRSTNGILERLGIGQLDILLLHRPDALVEPEEVARAFDELAATGRVRFFGVSNHDADQIALLQKFLDMPLVVNQVQLSVLHSHVIDKGVRVNVGEDRYAAAGGVLELCRLADMQVQAWSPLAGGQPVSPADDAPAHVQAVAQRIAELAQRYDTSREAIALAWLLRHPAGIVPVIGTTNRERLANCCLADDVELSREEWYELFVLGRGRPLP